MTRRISFFLLIALIFSSCMKVGPNYVPPGLSHLSDEWNGKLPDSDTDSMAVCASSPCPLQQWWTKLEDPILNSLIELATSDNLDIKQSIARIKQYRAQVAIAAGNYLPQLNINGYTETQKWNFSSSRPLPIALDLPEGIAYGNASLSWEIDLFGRIQRSIEATKADWQANIEDYQNVLLILYAEIATTYVNFRTLQNRIEYANRNVGAQRQTLDLTEQQYRKGIGTQVDVVRAKSNLYNSESQIPALLLSMEEAKNRLAILVGRQAGAINDLLTQTSEPQIPQNVCIGIPLDAVRQRPDIREAERSLASKTAQIGIETANLYPQFTLFGSFTGIGVPTEGGNRIKLNIFGIGPGVSWDIFNGGITCNRIRAARAVVEAAYWNYHQTILTATQEVEDSIAGVNQELERHKILNLAVKATEDAVRLVFMNYTQGILDFQAVLDAERSLFNQQDQYAASYGKLLGQYISLYKAIGGGW